MRAIEQKMWRDRPSFTGRGVVSLAGNPVPLLLETLCPAKVETGFAKKGDTQTKRLSRMTIRRKGILLQWPQITSVGVGATFVVGRLVAAISRQAHRRRAFGKTEGRITQVSGRGLNSVVG